MTVALGFNCPDGLVLCTDSLDSDGISKTRVDKIWSYETQDQWGIAVASAGESDFCESFTDNLRELFTGEQFDNDWILGTLRQAINAARVSYPDLRWSALFGFYGPDILDRRLLRVSEFSKHLAPVARYEAAGAGAVLAKFLCANMYTLFMTVDEAALLAVYVVQQCIDHVEGCEGPISLLHFKIGEHAWVPYHPNEVKKLLARFKDDKLRANLLNFWKQLTPDVTRSVKYDDLRHGGFVKWHRAVATKPLRSISRKSKRMK